MTWLELVKQHWGDISDSDADFILWNLTCYPLGSVEQVTQQLAESYANSHGSLDRAMSAIDAEVDLAMEEYRKIQMWDILKDADGN